MTRSVRALPLVVAALVLAGCGVDVSSLRSDLARSERFSKLDAAGAAVPVAEGPWACVTDASTGLTWENKSDDEGIRHYNWTFAFHAPDHRLEGTCNRTRIGTCDTRGYVEAVNRVRLCGFDDWRVPTLDELQTLLEPTARPPEPQVMACFFDNTENGSHWTRTPMGDGRIAGLNFADGSVQSFSTGSYLYLRLVRP